VGADESPGGEASVEPNKLRGDHFLDRRYWLGPLVIVGLIAVVVTALTIGSSVTDSLLPAMRKSQPVNFLREDIVKARTISPLRGRIVAIAESQLGYRTSPPTTYCNKFSAYWDSGLNNCGSANLNEEWCADFAAWVWQRAGVKVVYRYRHGDLNSSAVSFYEWGVAHRSWHPIGSGYRPRPGDVAVYGLNVAALFASHDAIVINYSPGRRGPDAVNGDGNRTGFSVVELARHEYRADLHGQNAGLISGYVSPV